MNKDKEIDWDRADNAYIERRCDRFYESIDWATSQLLDQTEDSDNEHKDNQQ